MIEYPLQVSILLLLATSVQAAPNPKPKPNPNPDVLSSISGLNIFGGKEAVGSIGRKVCDVFSAVDTIGHEINIFKKPPNVTEEQAFEEMNNMVAQAPRFPLLTQPFGLDAARLPSWLTVFGLYNGFTYCKTKDAQVLERFAAPNPNITQSADHMLPTGQFKVASLQDFNAFMGNGANATELDGRFVVTISDENRLITLTWRGSQLLNDFKADGNGTDLFLSHKLLQVFGDTSLPSQSDGILSAQCRLPANTDGYFMFAGYAQTMQPPVLDRLVETLLQTKQMHPDYTIVINGHSLGAVKSLLTAFYLSKFYANSIPIAAVYAYSQPLIGSTLLATWISNCITPSKIIRVVGENDAVPWGRAATNIQHPSNVLELYNPDHSQNVWTTCMGPSDKSCSHQSNCMKKSWEFHSFIGSVRLGGPLCWYIDAFVVPAKNGSITKAIVGGLKKIV